MLYLATAKAPFNSFQELVAQAFEAHQQTPHFKKYLAEAVSLLASRERSVWKRL